MKNILKYIIVLITVFFISCSAPKAVVVTSNIKNPIDVNTAIVLGGMKSRMDTIKKYVRADKWIITQSEKQYRQLKWKQWCDQNAIECVSIKDHGAYSYDILE